MVFMLVINMFKQLKAHPRLAFLTRPAAAHRAHAVPLCRAPRPAATKQCHAAPLQSRWRNTTREHESSRSFRRAQRSLFTTRAPRPRSSSLPAAHRPRSLSLPAAHPLLLPTAIAVN